jgi:DNA-nicking Smr family endonuclease
MSDDDYELPAAIVVAITDELDLHTFAPADVADLVDEYLREARARGFATVRIIHGKGRGVLRRTVHAVLDRHDAVASYRLADERAGSWGATLVALKPRA